METASLTKAVLRNGLRLLTPVVAFGLLVLFFGPATYRDLAAGRLSDAALGGIALVLLGAVSLYWLYKRATTVRRRLEAS